MDDIQPATADGPNAAAVAPTAGAVLSVGSLTGLTMKRRGPVAVWLGLPLITLGIYHLVWYYNIHKELREFDRRRTLSPAGSTLVLVLLGWTVIAPLISYYNTGRSIANAQRAAGLQTTCNPGTGCLLFIALGLNTWYLQRELNLVATAYPGVTPGTEVALVA